MLLFRYFSSHAFESLRDARLKVSRISSFNDPFESRWGSGGEMTRPKAKKLDRLVRKEIASQIRQSNPFLKTKEIKRHLKLTRDERLNSFLTDYAATEEAAMIKRGQIIDQTFRVICFASSEADFTHEILMWSHYSASHRGVRIGFQFPKTNTFNITNIDYVDKRVSVDMSVLVYDPKSQTNSIARSIRTKSQAWAYEKEHRLFIEPDNCKKEKNASGEIFEFIPIEREWVKRIDFGTRYPTSDRAIFLELIRKQYPHVKCYQACYHKSDYALSYEALKP